jgi:hypothetical protein
VNKNRQTITQIIAASRDMANTLEGFMNSEYFNDAAVEGDAEVNSQLEGLFEALKESVTEHQGIVGLTVVMLTLMGAKKVMEAKEGKTTENNGLDMPDSLFGLIG